MTKMDKLHSYCVDFLRDQNMIAQIEVAEEKQSTSLNLSCFHIETVPNRVFKLRHLKKLYLDENRLKELSDRVSELENLTVLTVDHNLLTDLPSTLHKLKNLVHLNVSHNPMKRLPEVVTELSSLESLWVNSAQLSLLPSSLQLINGLLTLGARGNLLSHYPLELCCLFHLRWLTLEGNRLKQLPDEFQNLINLKHLNLSSNLFEDIPPPLVHIKGLQFCFMQQNSIVAVSEIMLAQMKHLKRLDLRGNPVSSIINRKVFTYIVLENGQSHNTQQESSDSEDYECSIASSDINNSSGASQDEVEPEFETTLPQLSRFALSGT